MSKNEEIIGIKEIVKSNGLCLNASFYDGKNLNDMTPKELKEFFMELDYTSDLQNMSIPELKHKLAELEKIRDRVGLNNKPMSRQEFNFYFEKCGYTPPEVSDEYLSQLSKPPDYNPTFDNLGSDDIKHEIDRLMKVVKWK
jgi:hypothetical protein